MPIRDGSGEMELSSFSSQKDKSGRKVVVMDKDEQMNRQKTMEVGEGGGGMEKGRRRSKGWERGNLSYRKYLP